MRIEINNLNKTYKSGKKALRNINISLQSPNLIGLLGPNGAGKSTLMRMLVSNIQPTSGRILIDGQPLTLCEKELKSKLGYLPQEFGMYEELTVYQFLDYMASLKEMTACRKAMIDPIIEKINLVDKRNSRIRTLSGGQKQRVGIGQALLGNPQLLILDEPTVGLDPEERMNARNLFAELARERIVILSTHIIEDIQSVCNRLIVIHQGDILFDGSPEELIKMAEGHVGVYEEMGDELHNKLPQEYKITSKVMTTQGVSYRIVGDKLPDFAELAPPTLEDAYLFLVSTREE